MICKSDRDNVAWHWCCVHFILILFCCIFFVCLFVGWLLMLMLGCTRLVIFKNIKDCCRHACRFLDCKCINNAIVILKQTQTLRQRDRRTDRQIFLCLSTLLLNTFTRTKNNFRTNDSKNICNIQWEKKIVKINEIFIISRKILLY